MKNAGNASSSYPENALDSSGWLFFTEKAVRRDESDLSDRVESFH